MNGLGGMPGSMCGEGDEENYDSIHSWPALCRIGR